MGSCCAAPDAAQVSYPVPPCTTPQTYDYTIGDPGQVTVYSGDYKFAPGNYHVIGNLYFGDGRVDIPPGTVFSMDGDQKNTSEVINGTVLTIGNRSTVNAEDAIFNATCDRRMWKGFVFEPNQTEQALILARCGIANAEYGVYVAAGCTGAYYNLNNSRFEQNLYHVVDQGNHIHGVTPVLGISTIQDCYFYSAPNLLPPYQGSATQESWTYTALRLTPGGGYDGPPRVTLLGTNTIIGAIYGLVANVPGQGFVYQDGGVLNVQRTVRTAIWLDIIKENIRLASQIKITMSGATGIAARSYQSLFTRAGEPQYGLVAAGNQGMANVKSITINGGTTGDTTVYRTQTGVLFDELHAPMSNFYLSGLTFGASLRGGSGLVTDNTFYGCLHGLHIRPNTGPYTASFDISCNTFSANGAATSSGIYIDPNATLNNQGTITYPVGNKFQGYGSGARSIVNDGSNTSLRYFRYSGSASEEITNTITNSIPPLLPKGRVTSTTNPSYPLNNYCLNLRTALAGAQNRGTSRTAYMQALMDTLRRQAAPVARLGQYQATIRQWLLQQAPDTAALDAYVRTLPATNPNAFLALGLDLLEQYRRTGRQGLAAALRPALAARAAASPAASARLAFSDVISRLPGTRAPRPGQRLLSAADSLALRRVARTPGGTAEMAAQWFNYLYPRAGVRAAVARPEAGSATVGQDAALSPIQALYPNPAADKLHVEVAVPATGKDATIRLTDLLSGKVLAQARLATAGKGLAQSDLDVRGLPTGQYVATVLVDDVPVATQKVLINR